jgi:hypothetical protein
MSAFIVSHAHINALISYGNGPRDHVRAHLADGSVLDFTHNEDLQRAATILLAENYRSIHTRYPDTIENPDGTPGAGDELMEPIVFNFSSYYPRQAVHILKMCQCYDYQACESDDYYESDAAKIVDVIRHRAIRNLDGYDDAPWDWNMPDLSPTGRAAILAKYAAKAATEAPPVDTGSSPRLTIEREGEWTWIKFTEKPGEAIRAALKALGARFSGKRSAWYITAPVDVPTLLKRLAA